MTSRIQLRSKVPADEAERTYPGKLLNEDSYDLVVRGDANVYRPNGTLLLSLAKDVLTDDVVDSAREALLWLKRMTSENRGTYSGGFTGLRLLADGSLSKASISLTEDGKPLRVRSAIVGYFERRARTPFCRETAFTSKEVERWRSIMPLTKAVADAFRMRVPDRYAAQMNEAKKSNPAFIIEGTPFTTLTVNNTVRAACHRDKGDLATGFGVLTAMHVGRFRGFELVFPEYRVAVDVGPRDVCFFDAHELHANAPWEAIDEGAERVSCVYYFRDGMQECGSPEEERERAKRARGALTPDAAVDVEEEAQ